MNKQNENEVKELSKEEMANVQGGLTSGTTTEAVKLAVVRPPLNFYYNMGLPGI